MTDKYVLPVSGHRFDRDGLIDYWLDLIAGFDLVMLEDPLAETDEEGWSARSGASAHRAAASWGTTSPAPAPSGSRPGRIAPTAS
ncbi:hypothetical protein ACFVYD_19640 [Streptomyces sp. NPDC058301]|uniref:hypothetical protein n=1 Tax=Streptomyces sp. NPDC058301 TaxID=3346436 RepID=UPI0036EA7DBC